MQPVLVIDQNRFGLDLFGPLGPAGNKGVRRHLEIVEDVLDVGQRLGMLVLEEDLNALAEKVIVGLLVGGNEVEG